MSLKGWIIGSIAMVVLLLVGAVWMSRPQPKPEVLAANAGKLQVSGDNRYDFGTISMAKGLVSKRFVVTNSDSAPATVTKLFTSCMCTKATLWVGGQKWGPFGMPGHNGAIPNIAAVINPGETAEVEVIFDPAAHGPAGVGQIERVITLQQNGQQPLTFNFKALVTP